MTSILDQVAREAGRDPAEIRRIYNVSGSFAPGATGFLAGDPALWAERLTARYDCPVRWGPSLSRSEQRTHNLLCGAVAQSVRAGGS